jgi:sulfite exporter TauE/SafE
MYYIAFTLGFLSSLHCIGMCGPLALAAQGMFRHEQSRLWFNAVLYNLGRIISYVLLGSVFGLFGSFLALTGYQKGISIFSGILLLLIFAFSVQPDALLGNIPVTRRSYRWIQNRFHTWANKSLYISRLVLGILNGFLPCGMVYIALAGALSLQNVFGSMGFMLFFGLGTFPAMAGIMLAGKWFQSHWRTGLQKVYPIVTLLLGLYLIYRGVFSTTPLELNFLEALKNPVMCH